MKRFLLSLFAALLVLPGIFGTDAQALPNQWNGSGPLATGLGNRVITALALSPDGKTVYSGTGSGTVFSYDLPPDLTAVGVSGTTQTATTLSATSDKAATAYWVVVARSATAPSPAEVKARASYASVTIVASGTDAMLANVAKAFAVSGLLGSTDYDLYVVAEDGGGNISAPPVRVQFSTALNTYAITLSVSPAGSGIASCDTNPVSQGGSSTCTASANTGYTFSGWSGDCTGATCALTNVTSAKSVTATFTLNTYAITATASPLAGGSVSCSPNPVSHGSNSTCTATANTGYTFTGFSGACSGGTCVLSNVTSAQNVTASFVLNTYTITATASPLAGGSVSCSPNPVSHGSNSTCTATANTGYTFTAFSGACTGASCVLNNVTATQSVTATFTLNTYAITATASPLAGGSVSCSPNPVSHGSNSTCTATANTGYTFTAFSGACTGASCVLNNVTAIQSVTATFTLNTYAITATANPVAGGSVSCTPNPVTHGSNASCTATANAGYTFSAFSGDCTGATCALTNVTSAKSVTANYIPAPTVTAISPTTGTVAGGTAVTITGTNFTGASAVTIGGAAATSVTVVNATSITATTPAGTPGAKDVVVTTPGGSGTGTGLYTYATVPGIPTAPTATAGNAQVSVAFTAPASNGGAAIDGYRATCTAGFVGTATASPVTVTGLTNGASYSCTVAAHNIFGYGAESVATASVTPKATQTITWGATPVVIAGGTGTVSATASSGLTPIVFSVPAATPVRCTVTSATPTSAIVTGVSVGVCLVHADQAGDANYGPAQRTSLSLVVIGTGVMPPPSAPTLVSVEAGPGRATLSFLASVSTGGPPIVSYTATCTASGQPNRTATGFGSPLVVYGLTGGVVYSCSVTASDGTNFSDPSSAMQVTPGGSFDIMPILMLLLLD